MSMAASRPLSPSSRAGTLPYEVVDEILKFAASSSRRACLTLCTVSSWAQHISLPYLLSTISFGADGHAEAFLRIIATPLSKPVQPALVRGDFVRHLWMPHAPGPSALTALQRCTRLTNFALSDAALAHVLLRTSTITGRSRPQAVPPRDLQLTVISTGAHPDDLFVRLPARFGRRLRRASPVYGMATHLRLWLALPLARQLKLERFARLTHLAVRVTLLDAETALPAFERVLRLPRLQVLVVELEFEVLSDEAWAAFDAWLRRIRRTDRRALFASFAPCSLLAEWEDEVRGEGVGGVWARAVRETAEWDRKVAAAGDEQMDVESLSPSPSPRSSYQRPRLLKKSSSSPSTH